MATSSWQAFFYEGSDTRTPPVRSTWIDAEREEDAVRIAKESLKRGQCAELTRPRWEGGSGADHGLRPGRARRSQERRYRLTPEPRAGRRCGESNGDALAVRRCGRRRGDDADGLQFDCQGAQGIPDARRKHYRRIV